MLQIANSLFSIPGHVDFATAKFLQEVPEVGGKKVFVLDNKNVFNMGEKTHRFLL